MADWFPHDYNAGHDPRIRILRARHGMVGIGVYWTIIEAMHSQGGVLSEIDVMGIEADLRHGEPLADIMQTAIGIGLLHKHDDGSLSSRRVDDNLQERDERQARRVESGRIAGKASAKSRRKLNESSTILNDCERLVNDSERLRTTIQYSTVQDTTVHPPTPLAGGEGVGVGQVVGSIQPANGEIDTQRYRNSPAKAPKSPQEAFDWLEVDYEAQKHKITRSEVERWYYARDGSGWATITRNGFQKPIANWRSDLVSFVLDQRARPVSSNGGRASPSGAGLRDTYPVGNTYPQEALAAYPDKRTATADFARDFEVKVIDGVKQWVRKQTS